jgi:hypothetical protein
MGELVVYGDTLMVDLPSPDTGAGYQLIAWADFANTNPFGNENSAGTDIVISSDRELTQERLKQRWPSILAKARQAQEKYPDAVDALIAFFEGINIEEETRRSVIEEPYG